MICNNNNNMHIIYNYIYILNLEILVRIGKQHVPISRGPAGADVAETASAGEDLATHRGIQRQRGSMVVGWMGRLVRSNVSGTGTLCI